MSGILGQDSLGSLVLGSNEAADPLAPIVHDSLNLNQTATIRKEVSIVVSQSLGITDSGTRGHPLPVTPVSQSLGLSQSAVVSREISISASNSLGLTDSITPGARPEAETSDSLELSDSGSLAVSRHIVVSDHLGLTDRAVRIVNINVTQSLNLTQDGFRATEATDQLDLNESMVAGKGAIVSQPLGVGDTVHVAGDFKRSVSSSLNLRQAIVFVVVRDTTRFEYTPFVGSTTDPNAPTPPPTSMPADSGLTGVKLIFPSTGMATDTITLRGPNFGNTDRLAMDRILRYTRGGQLIVFADPIWPKTETLLVMFSGLKRSEAQAVATFYAAHLGQEIRLIDWEGRAWKGVIISQEPMVADDRKTYTIGFSFEGSRE